MTIPYIPAQRGATPVTSDWRAYAACRHADPGLFFPVGTTEAALLKVNRAKQICAGCPVRQACLDWALATGQQVGVWGGTVADERRALRAQRARALPLPIAASNARCRSWGKYGCNSTWFTERAVTCGGGYVLANSATPATSAMAAAVAVTGRPYRHCLGSARRPRMSCLIRV
jgi:WhiB family transcriptional regulator, redox-sensing transcriptional regulator